MVEAPARARARCWTPGLAETVSDDAGEEPGLLPLLSTSLMQLWERLTGGPPDLPGVRGSGACPGRSPTSPSRLHALGDPTSRLRSSSCSGWRAARAARSSAAASRSPSWRAARQRRRGRRSPRGRPATHRCRRSGGGRARVVVPGVAAPGRVARRTRSTRSVQHRLAVAAGQWEEQGRDPGLLWRGAGLQSALEVVAAYPEEATPPEQDFLAPGRGLAREERRAAEERAEQRERQNRCLRTLCRRRLDPPARCPRRSGRCSVATGTTRQAERQQAEASRGRPPARRRLPQRGEPRPGPAPGGRGRPHRARPPDSRRPAHPAEPHT